MTGKVSQIKWCGEGLVTMNFFVYTIGSSDRPFCSERPLESNEQPDFQVFQDSEIYPGRNIAAPGLDASSWNGALLVGKKGSLWGVRVGYYDDEDHLITGPLFYENVDRSGPYATDGSFAKITAGPLEISWARLDNLTIVGKVCAKTNMKINIEAYAPYYYPNTFLIENSNTIKGTSPYIATTAGEQIVTGGHILTSNRFRIVEEEANGMEYFQLTVSCPSQESRLVQSDTGTRSAQLDYNLRPGDSITFTASMYDPIVPNHRLLSHDDIVTMIDQSESYYHKIKLTGEGLARGAEAMINEMYWMNTYHIYDKNSFFPAGRTWMQPSAFNIWGWDETLSGLIVAYGGDEEAVHNQFMLSIGDERLGLLCIWYSYAIFQNKKPLEQYYPAYQAVYPIGDNELVKGGGQWNGEVGKGMDDTPMREHSRCLGEMYSLDMSCYKALGLEILGNMAAVLGKDEEARLYRQNHRILIQRINDTFWNEELGIYKNRYISGEWANVYSPTSFYPWLAGVPSPQQSEALLKNLLNPDKFWGKFVIPTLSKDDPEYGKPSFEKHGDSIFPPYSYWRGAIWPPSNYLVYLGLKRYRLDQAAAEFAEKTMDLWWETWVKTGWSCENYNPETGERTQSSSSQSHQSWAQLFPLIGIQELLDSEVWSEQLGIRFGTMAPGTHSLQNLKLHGHTYSIRTDEAETEVWRDGILAIKGSGGKFVVRHFIENENGYSFEIDAQDPISVVLYPGIDSVEHGVDVQPGKHNITIAK